MRRATHGNIWLYWVIFFAVVPVCAATPASRTEEARDGLPDAPVPQSVKPENQPASSATSSSTVNGPSGLAERRQTKRILYIIPNFRSVSADVKLPPTSTREKFGIFAGDSFDYSAFAEVAILSGIGDLQNSDPSFGGGFTGYAQYYWRSYIDNTDGNLMTEFVFPYLTREDPRYYTLGHGSGVRRAAYALSMIVITRNNQGNPTPNFSEVLGNGVAASVSNLYYPSTDQGLGKTGERVALQIGVDGLSNLLKEFWPDLDHTVFRDKY